MTTDMNLALPQLNKAIHAALKHWHTVDDKPQYLLSNLLCVQNKLRESGPQTASSLRLATNEILLAGLDRLKQQHPQSEIILKKRFLDQFTITAVSNSLGLTVDQVKHKQREALHLLAAIILALETEVREAHVTQQEGHLVAKTYTKLFGVDTLSDELLTALTSSSAPWVISLVGLGGIGKTALANYTVRRAIRLLYYEEIVWLTIANQTTQKNPLSSPNHTFQQIVTQLGKQLLPALPGNTRFGERLMQLQQLLKSQSYLIVVDNLELKADTAYLLSELVTLAQPSRFLLTSRTVPADHAGSLTINLPELTQQDSLALIRHYAEDIVFQDAIDAQDEELLPIYDVVGGNPFALKQLVNLARIRPLPSLLAALRERPLTNGEAIYQHILKETWITLSDDAKAVLSIMPLAAEGGMDPEQMLHLSRLSQERLWPAIMELIGLSLLEVRSSQIWERFYGIHRLTYLFVRSLLDDDGL